MKKYNLWFTFVDTPDQAQTIIDDYNRTATAWQKKKYPAHATEWSSLDGKEQKNSSMDFTIKGIVKQ